MIYPEAFEQKLGFDVIRQKLASYCLSSAGASEVGNIRFSTDPAVIRERLKLNLEFRQILEKGEAFPSRHFYDAEEWLKRIALEGNYLEPEEFLHLARALETIIACRDFLLKAEESYPSLAALARPVSISRRLPEIIDSKIDDQAKVRDSASPELGRIRKRLREEQSHLRRLVDQMFRKAVEQKLVPEGALPTVREGRVVIPVLAEHKRRIRGFILDESATGQTVFIEPAEMLEANNEIRELEHEEKREVIRILKTLADQLREELPVLREAFAFLARMDCIRAQARFALETGGEMPVVNDEPALTWYNARHPLLYLSLKGKREVVPLNIELNASNRMLLVSGPNAGGKSVALKTIGLLQYMLQCGLLVPMSDRSRAGIFTDIFLDIGDQQSIENDLSTYSSHLRNMAVFIRSSSAGSLVLMDELGSGTDPNFGGAIAEAVLESLLQKQVWGLATTHYYNLKLFAGRRPGIRNAAMRFDDRNLEPLYILDIGKPGSSFALEIARKTGLPQSTLEMAEKLVGKDLAGFETLVRNLERERQELSEKIKHLEKKEADTQQLLARYQELTNDIESRKKEIINKAKEEAALLLKETNREIEKTIRHIRENQAERKETRRARKNLESLSARVKDGVRPQPVKSQEPIREGDRVRIQGQQSSGIVLSIKGKTASVQFGELKSVVNVSLLEKAGAGIEPVVKKLQSVGLNINEKLASFQSTLDVRGRRAEEVIPLVDQFMDTAILLGQGEVRILHGKGEGILRQVVRDRVRKFKEVASIADEHIERGGDGVTVIVLK